MQAGEQKDTLLARSSRLESEDRKALCGALGRLHRDMQSELDAGTAYAECVQDLADSRVSRPIGKEILALSSRLYQEVKS